MIRNEIYVNSLSQYIEEVVKLKNAVYPEQGKNVLWFRGHRNYEWSLIPSLFRGVGENKTADDRGYTNISLREGLRQQQNHAKNYQFLKNDGLNPIEWMAVAQHYGIKTRLLDWSTSAIHALLFALEYQFAKPGEFKDENNLPCVWCLFPQRMNRDTTQYIIDNRADLGILLTQKEKDGFWQITEFLKKVAEDGSNLYKTVFFESAEKEDEHLNYLYNLAHFEELLAIVESRPSVAYEGGLINPLYYILDKIYGNGIGIGKLCLSPLAIIHPYHSERIKAQQGVFTIFPNLITDKLGETSDMRGNPAIMKHLNRIIIQSPGKVAEELKALGAHRSWLYPEEPIVSQEIESGL